MIKKLKKVLLALSSLIILGVGAGIVYAGTNDSNIVKDRYDNAYAVYDGTDRIHLFYAERFLMNGKTAYCLEPGVAIKTDIYSSTEDWSITGLSSEVRSYVRLVAYYGYDYTNHQTRNYYLASQELIWEKITGRETYWVTELDKDSTRINIDNEKNEIIRLVNNHYKTPSFDEGTYEINIGESITLNDTNGVLSEYQIYNANGLNVSLNGNSLKIDSKDTIQTTELQLVKKNYTSQITLIYHSGNNQKLVSTGVLDPVVSSLKIKTVGGNITIEKLDRETGNIAQGDATLGGAKYEVYNFNNELVDTLIFGEKNKTKDLPYGNYTLKEIEASKGYELDETIYNVTLNSTNIDVKTNVYEDVIKRKVDFFKVYASDKTGILIGEPNVQFDIYLKSSNNLYKTITTDDKGYAEVELVYGTYVVKQVTSTKDYEKVDDFEIVIDHSEEQPMYELLSNAEIQSRLKVIKVDEDTGKVILRAGIKFKIKNVTTDEYVCQRITYPTIQNICEYETNDKGEFITPYQLPAGKYVLEELDQKIEGYVWNKESVEFEIGENSKLINDEELGILFEVKFANKEVKGKINIHKFGEDFIINNGTYQYEKNNLEGVEFGVYASEDIYNQVGDLIYSKDELIDSITSNEKGDGSLENLYIGKYYLLESKTLDNYVLDKNKYEFEITYQDQYTEVVEVNKEIQNYLKKGTLDFTKTDISTSNPLPNTKIEIYTENDELIFSGYTDEKGKITITDLSVGKYYILEKEAPEGYYLNEEKMYFEILENGEVVKATMVDEKIVVEVPNTGVTDYHALELSCMLLMICGGVLIYYAKKKRK